MLEAPGACPLALLLRGSCLALMPFTRIAHTAKGSTIDALGGNCFRVCDPQGHCQTVQGLWNAEEVIRRSEKSSTTKRDCLLPKPIRRPVGEW